MLNKSVCFFFTLYLMLPLTALAQIDGFRTYDYGEIGLSLSIPASWQHDGLSTTTKAAFIAQFGWHYDKPDAGDIWNAVGRFSSVEVDSSRLPDASAYVIHNLTVFVNRAHTLYRKWLCRQHRSAVWEAKPLVSSGGNLIENNKIDPFEVPANLSGATLQNYTYATGAGQALTHGHIASFVHEERCFDIKIESTASSVPYIKRLHNQILSQLTRVAF